MILDHHDRLKEYIGAIRRCRNGKQVFIMQTKEIGAWADDVWGRIVSKVEVTSQRISDTFPYVSLNGKYNNDASDWWTNGFWPGLLWLIYQETGNERLKEIAISCENKLDEPLHAFTGLHHDVGFMWVPSSVAQYKLLGSEESKVRALTAASHLAGRFNVKGRFIRAWNPPERVGWAIIDCMMNLSLLYWASAQTGDPRFRHIATEHADMALREFIRPDGSVHHIVCFDPETGDRIEALGGQGYSPDSAWARGSAWALYGFAISYRYTQDERYLEAAKRAAQFFVAQAPLDKAPPWDFRAPTQPETAEDSSAAACAASGMLEIAQLVPEEEASFFTEKAVALLKMLDTRYGTWDDPTEEGLLRGGTANFPKRHYVEVPIIYGDYYFAEAIGKLRGAKESFW
jgi:unsaturated chondroitin disaccharide hydrolase